MNKRSYFEESMREAFFGKKASLEPLLANNPLYGAAHGQGHRLELFHQGGELVGL